MTKINLTPQKINAIKMSPKGVLPPFIMQSFNMPSRPREVGITPSRESLRTENYNRVKAGKSPVRVYHTPRVA